MPKNVVDIANTEIKKKSGTPAVRLVVGDVVQRTQPHFCCLGGNCYTPGQKQKSSHFLLSAPHSSRSVCHRGHHGTVLLQKFPPR